MNELNNYESDSDNNVNDSVETTKKHELKQDYLERFEKLKEKRLKLQHKQLKKEQKKNCLNVFKKQIKNECEKSSVNSGVNEEVKLKEHFETYTNIVKKLDDWKQPDEIEEENNLKKQLNCAIKENNFDLAEELNEKLIEHESKLHINYAVNALKYEKQTKESDLPSKKTKKLKWQFEAKERWESKANM